MSRVLPVRPGAHPDEERIERAADPPHEWEWVDHDEAFRFGDPDKPYVVDIYRCRRCRREVRIDARRLSDPSPGRCAASR